MTHHTHADTMEHLIPSQVCTYMALMYCTNIALIDAYTDGYIRKLRIYPNKALICVRISRGEYFMTHHTHADTMEHLIPSQEHKYVFYSYICVHIYIYMYTYIHKYI